MDLGFSKVLDLVIDKVKENLIIYEKINVIRVRKNKRGERESHSLTPLLEEKNILVFPLVKKDELT